MAISASSVVYDLTSEWYELLNKETSAARKMATDSSNTNAVEFKDFWRALCRSVNALDGTEGYPVGHVASAGKQVASTRVTTSGGSAVWTSGLTSVDCVWVTPNLDGDTAPGTSYQSVFATVTGGTVTIRAYKPTSDSDTTATAITNDRDFFVVAIGE